MRGEGEEGGEKRKKRGGGEECDDRERERETRNLLVGREGIVRLCDEIILVTINSSFRDDDISCNKITFLNNLNFSRVPEKLVKFFIGDSNFAPPRKSLREEVDFAPQTPPFLPACKGASPQTC